MNWQELQQRIETWEDLHTEFKEWPVRPVELAATLVAFANTDGGQLILGIADDRPGEFPRINDQVACQNCEPPLTVVQETVRADSGAVVVVVNVPKGDQRPYRTIRGDFYIRTSSGRRRASRQELLRLFQAVESLAYDETVVLRATTADLSAQAFDRFLRQAYGRALRDFDISYEQLLLNWRLLQEREGTQHPTVAGLLFFGWEPQRFLPQAHVVAARIPGNDLSAVPSDTEQIQGSLPTLLDDAIRFLRAHLLTPHRIRGFEPEAYPELPEDALRETLVNALAHRDYTIPAPVRLFVYDDRVEVRTPGGLPNSVTIEAIKLGAAHVLRNPTLYTLFSRLGLVTGIGSGRFPKRGVFRTIQWVREATGQEPTIVEVGNELFVALPRRLTV